jgi:hypothetical protein
MRKRWRVTTALMMRKEPTITPELTLHLKDVTIRKADGSEFATLIGSRVDADLVGLDQQLSHLPVSKDNRFAPIIGTYQKSPGTPHFVKTRCAPDRFAWKDPA